MPTVGSKIAAGVETIYRALKTLAVGGVLALAGYLLVPLASEYISHPGVLVSVVVVIAVVIITLWRQAARKPPRPNKKFLNGLLHSEPITPNHDPPKSAGGAYSSLAGDDDKRFFADFAAFADVVNWWFADKHVDSCWRLQELSDGHLLLSVDASFGPTLGRSYDVFHNQVRVGRLEISPGGDYGAETPAIFTEIELHSIRLLSFDSVAGFLRDIAMHVTDRKAKTDVDFDVNHAIVSALTKALWETQRITEFEDLDGQDWGELSLHLQGHAPSWYFRRREALQRKAHELKASM